MFQLHEQQKKLLSSIPTSTNTLVIAKTGSGKSYVSLSLITDIVRNGDTGRAIIVAPTNILTDQHYKLYVEISKIKCFLLRAGCKKNLSQLSQKTPGLYICTSQYALILLNSGVINADDFDVIVFDEAHRGNGPNTYYSKVASYFRNRKIYGFTATAGSEMCKKKIMQNLYLDTCVEGESPYLFKRNYKYVVLRNRAEYYDIGGLMDSWIARRYPTLTNLIKPPPKTPICSYIVMNRQRFLNLCSKHNVSLFDYYKFFFLHHCKYLLSTECKRSYEEFRDRHKITIPSTISNMIRNIRSHPSKYVYITQKVHTSNGSTLVFFQNYTSCLDFKIYLTDVLKISIDKIAVLAGKTKLSRKAMQHQIHKCKSGVQYILSTSVIEQGVNIHDVDRVVFIKPISNLTRIVQREGRTGRYRDGSVYVLCYKRTHQYHGLKQLISKKSGM